jgi:microcin C transport system permease protein
MTSYILRRLLLMIPTILGILLVNFLIVQAAPGGPVEQVIARLQGHTVDATARFSAFGTMEGEAEFQSYELDPTVSKYRGAQGVDPELLRELERIYGFDQPAHRRFLKMLRDYLLFDFGESFYRDQQVVDLVMEKLPVSISLGLWSTLLIYGISIPLGIAKAIRDGSRFDVWSSTAVVVGNAIPSFLFAVLLVVLFAGGHYLNWFPLRGLVSPEWETFGFLHQVADYFWHLALPLSALAIGGFAGLTLLTKNSFLDEINKQYVMTAYAKGLSDRRVLYHHVFRNAMLVVIAGFPRAFVHIFFTGALLIEVIFSLDGLGLLGYEAAVGRDYPVMFATLYFFTLLGLLTQLLSDLSYTLVDRRIDFETREA